ncbi:MAG: carbonic anhydrase [Candidatus Micrarchaeota archaeon]
MRLVLSCMDRRLNEYLDSLNDGNTIFLRNAGANLYAVKNTVDALLNNENITEIKVITHTDCGAMKSVAAALSGKLRLDLAGEVLVDKFKGEKFATVEELEKINTELQKKAVEEIAKRRGIKGSAELLDLSKLNIPKEDNEHKFVLLEPSIKKYSDIISSEEMFNTYIIQSASLEEKLPDLEIAIKVLGIKRGEIIALKESEYRIIQAEASRLRLNQLLKDVTLSIKRL